MWTKTVLTETLTEEREGFDYTDKKFQDVDMQKQLWREEEEENKAIQIRDLVEDHFLRCVGLTYVEATIILTYKRKM